MIILINKIAFYKLHRRADMFYGKEPLRLAAIRAFLVLNVKLL